MSCWVPTASLVELLARGSHVDEDGSRLEAGSVLVGEAVQVVNVLLDSNAVHVAEGAARERREADAKDGGHVSVNSVADHAVLQAERGLVHETRRDARLNLLVVVLGRLHEGLHGVHSHGVRLDRLLGGKHAGNAAGGLARVGQEARSEALALDSSTLDRLHAGDVSAAHALLEVRTEVLVQVKSHLNANLVSQCHRTDRETEGLDGLVELEVVLNLHREHHGLVNVGAQAAVDEESRDVLDNDGELALLEAELNSSGRDLIRGALVGDDLEQLHRRHRREVMHAHDVLRTLCHRRDRCNGKGRGVGSDDHVLAAVGLHLGDNLVLDAEILEHSLDHHIAVLEVLGPESVLVGEANEPALGDVGVEHRHFLLLHLLVEARCDVLLTNLETLRVEVLEGDDEALVDGDLGDACAHESGAEHTDLLDRLRVLEGVLLQRSLAEEHGLETRALRGKREVSEAVSLEVVARSGAELLAASVLLDDLEDLEGRGVEAARGLHDLLRGRLEDVVAGERVVDDRVLDHLVHAFELAALHLECASRKALRSHHCSRLKLVHVAGGIDDLGRLGLLGLLLSALEQEGKGVLNADELGKAVGAAAARQDAEHNLGEAHDSARGLGGNAVVAGKGELGASTQAGAVDGSHLGLAALELVEERLELSRDLLDGILALFGLVSERLDVGASDEIALFGRDEHNRLDRRVRLKRPDNGRELVHESVSDQVDRGVGQIHAHNGDTARLQLNLVALGRDVGEGRHGADPGELILADGESRYAGSKGRAGVLSESSARERAGRISQSRTRPTQHDV
mmetsp:Transcript_17055/g.12114  ORF Transcript_17055/g.12114 Transcript_17055/m.12114 type:complete len:799 (+) Transcript_17055:135-2531(+)